MQELAGDLVGEGRQVHRLLLAIKEGSAQTRAQSVVFMHFIVVGNRT